MRVFTQLLFVATLPLDDDRVTVITNDIIIISLSSNAHSTKIPIDFPKMDERASGRLFERFI